MRPTAIVFVSLAAAACAIAAGAPAARACTFSCQNPSTFETAVWVFEGVLTHRSDPRRARHSDIPYFIETFDVVTVRVERVWKGDVPRTVRLRRYAFECMGDHNGLGTQTRYIMYPRGAIERPTLDVCDRRAWGEDLAAERAALGAPIRTYPSERRPR